MLIVLNLTHNTQNNISRVEKNYIKTIFYVCACRSHKIISSINNDCANKFYKDDNAWLHIILSNVYNNLKSNNLVTIWTTGTNEFSSGPHRMGYGMLLCNDVQ